MRILAIDPGNVDSGFAVVDSADCRPINFGKIDNRSLIGRIRAGVFNQCDGVAIEMVASYGMAVGREVFETCVWIGRFQEAALEIPHARSAHLTYRRDVKLHHCGQTSAKDSNITQALVDRFAPGASNFGKGTNAEPGWFHGFRKDIWQAYALAVLIADQAEGRQGVTAPSPRPLP